MDENNSMKESYVMNNNEDENEKLIENTEFNGYTYFVLIIIILNNTIKNQTFKIFKYWHWHIINILFYI